MDWHEYSNELEESLEKKEGNEENNFVYEKEARRYALGRKKKGQMLNTDNRSNNMWAGA